MGDFILEADSLEYIYPDGTRALKGASFQIKKGRKVVLLGPNGAGKSTVFLHFNGILRPSGGKVRFSGKDVRYDRSSLMNLRKSVGIVFQDPDSQLFSASVLQEISFGPLNLGLSKDAALSRVEAAMAATGISELASRPTHLLSYGQKKRVSIAGILAMEPEVIICDEPTAWLDPLHSKQILELFDDINKNGATVIMSTHDVNIAYAWPDYIYVMDDGKVVGEGAPGEIFQDDDLLGRAGLAKPWLVEVYNQLKAKGWITNGIPSPRSKSELFDLIPAMQR